MILVQTKDVAEATGLGVETIRGYAREGRIPYMETPGGHRRFDVDAVKMALAAEVARRRGEPMPRDPRNTIQWNSRRYLAYRIEDEPLPGRKLKFPGVPGSTRFLARRPLAAV